MEVKRIGKHVINIIMKQRFDINKRQTFENTIRNLLNSQTRTIAVDMADITKIDSAAISSLMKAHSLAQNLNINFYLYHIPKHIRLVFESSNLITYFHILSEQESRGFLTIVD
ncbi:MAG: STAS domain-containing protein [Spirochaetales bacterium]|nr:STAS domain-containing protein [Spirochaetales bacterium]